MIPKRYIQEWAEHALWNRPDQVEQELIISRALYQRRKGRDLFDLYYASKLLDLDYDAILYAYNEYMKFDVGRVPSKKQFLTNINEKESHPDFYGDLEGILRLGISYNQIMAFEWLRDQIVSRMR